MGGSGGFAGWSRWGQERLMEWSACQPKCGRLEVWRSGGGRDAWLLPPTEEVVESGDCAALGIAGGGGSVDPQIPRDGQTIPKSSSCTCQHHLNVAQESL
jgi:hypothetical protein